MTYITTKDDETNWAWRYESDPPVKIFLDGVEMRNVDEADDVAGFIVKPKQDAAGDIVTDGNEILFERLTGVVEIVGKLLERPPA